MLNKTPFILLLSLAGLLGITVGGVVAAGSRLAILSVALLVLTLIVCRKRNISKRYLIVISILIAGFWRGHITTHPKSNLTVTNYVNQSDITLTAVVAEPPEIFETSQRLRLTVIRPVDRPETLIGEILVTTRPYPRYEYGDQLKVKGELRLPLSTEQESIFPQSPLVLAGYPTMEKIVACQGNPLISTAYKVRARAETVLNRLLPEPEAALANGILLGVKKSIPSNFRENLIRTSTIHTVVVSGFNLSIVVNSLIGLTAFFGRSLSLILAAFGILGYSLLVGFSYPVLRALIMGLIVLLAKVKGREGDALTALFTSAALIAFNDPYSLGEISFQLSFLATFGLLIFSPVFQEVFKRWPKIIREPLGTTLAAQVAVFPVIVANFGEISFVAPLANTLIFLLVPPIMYLSALLTFLGLINLQLAAYLTGPVYLPLNLFVAIVNGLGSLSWASLKVF